MKSVTIRFPEDSFESAKVMARVLGVSFNSLVYTSVLHELDNLMKDSSTCTSYFELFKLSQNEKN